MRILVAQINSTIGDLKGNLAKILSALDVARQSRADLVLFPELALTGYPPGDFLLLPHFMEAVENTLNEVIAASSDIAIILGVPRRDSPAIHQRLFNSAAVIENGTLIGFQDKMLLPTYDVFDERRYFESVNQTFVWNLLGKKIGITVCEDLWQHSGLLKEEAYAFDPISQLQQQKPDYVFNLSASPFHVGKGKDRFQVCSKAALTLGCPVVLCNQVGGNDSLIFDGHSLVVNEEGHLLAMAKGFSEECLLVEMKPNHLKAVQFPVLDPIEELYQALVLGIRDYFMKSGFTSACLGLSGGIDSAVVACLAVEALGANNVLGICMPSRYSSEGSLSDAQQLADNLGLSYSIVPIEAPFQAYLELLTPHFEGKAPDTTEENLQARIRGMILMAFSNKHGYIALSTGNKSEVAMGYATLYGDMCGGLAVISDVTKLQVYALAEWINREKEIIPLSTLTKPPSAELRPNQKDSDSLPDYAIIDTVIEAYVEGHLSPKLISEKYGYPLHLVQNLIEKIHRSEYKRRQSPPCLRVTEKAFNAGRCFPIVQGFVR